MKAKQKRHKLIQVTQRDIELGVPEEAGACPIARSIARSFHKKIGIFFIRQYGITRDGSKIDGDEEWNLPGNARRFISRFDRGDRVAPFSFELVY